MKCKYCKKELSNEDCIEIFSSATFDTMTSHAIDDTKGANARILEESEYCCNACATLHDVQRLRVGDGYRLFVKTLHHVPIYLHNGNRRLLIKVDHFVHHVHSTGKERTDMRFTFEGNKYRATQIGDGLAYCYRLKG